MELKVASVTASRSMKVNVGNYESYDIFDSVTYLVTDEPDMIKISERAQKDLDDLQSAEMNRIYDLLEGRNIEKGLVIDLIELETED